MLSLLTLLNHTHPHWLTLTQRPTLTHRSHTRSPIHSHSSHSLTPGNASRRAYLGDPGGAVDPVVTDGVASLETKVGVDLQQIVDEPLGARRHVRPVRVSEPADGAVGGAAHQLRGAKEGGGSEMRPTQKRKHQRPAGKTGHRSDTPISTEAN